MVFGGLVSCVPGVRGAEGELVLDTLRLDSIIPLFDDEAEPALTLGYEVERPVGGSPQLVGSLDRMICSMVENGAYLDADNDVACMLGKFVDSHAGAYHDELNEFTKDELRNNALWLNYEASLRGRVIGQYCDFLSYEVVFYGYNGGAHGQTVCTCSVFDMRQMMPLQLSNVIDEATMPVVSQLFLDRLALFFDCSDYADLKAKGYLFDYSDPGPTENFFFDEKGITWVFNQYDIAPYAYGQPTVTLSWDELQPLLPSESPAMRVF